MGSNTSAALDTAALAKIKNDTVFSKDEILELHEQFKFISGGKEEVSKDVFLAGLRGVGLALSAEQRALLERMFVLFDTDRSNTVNFHEFCAGLSVFATNRLDDTIRTLFDMYDLGGSDYITKAEMLQGLKAISTTFELDALHRSTGEAAVVDATRRLTESKDSVEAWTNKVFSDPKFATGGKMTFPQFDAAVRSHPMLLAKAQSFVKDVCHDFFHMPSKEDSSRSMIQSLARNTRLTVAVCVHRPDPIPPHVQAIRTIFKDRAETEIFVYQAMQGDEVTAGRRNSTMELFAGFPKQKVFLDSQNHDKTKVADSIVRYAAANHINILWVGHPKSEKHTVPKAIREEFKGLGVVVGHLPDVASAAGINYLLCVDHSAPGLRAAQFLGAIARPQDQIILLSVWSVIVSEDFGAAMNSTDKQWKRHLQKLQEASIATALQSKAEVVKASQGTLPESKVTVVVEESNDWCEVVHSLDVKYRLDMSVVGLKSRTMSGKLMDQVIGNTKEGNRIMCCAQIS